MILFKKIRWRNLLSTGNNWTEVGLSSKSTTVIIGTNGAGKSTILDALTFVLFNNHLEKLISRNFSILQMRKIVLLK